MGYSPSHIWNIPTYIWDAHPSWNFECSRIKFNYQAFFVTIDILLEDSVIFTWKTRRKSTSFHRRCHAKPTPQARPSSFRFPQPDSVLTSQGQLPGKLPLATNSKRIPRSWMMTIPTYPYLYIYIFIYMCVYIYIYIICIYNMYI